MLNNHAAPGSIEWEHTLQGRICMTTSPIVESVFSLLIMIIVGAYSARRKILTPELSRGLVQILIEIALPFMILASFMFSYAPEIRANVIKAFYYSLAAYLITIAVSRLLLLPIPPRRKLVLHFANVFSNTGYVGFPILNAVYGAEGVVYGSIFNMFFVMLVWTYGITLYRGPLDRNNYSSELKAVLLNPSILAVAAGLITMFFGIQLPSPILLGVRSLGNMTGPLSMLIIGSILAKVKLRDHIRDWTLYYGAITKLVVIPLVIYACALLVGRSSMVLNTVVIMTAMPASTMTSIFAERYAVEQEYAAVIVSATTLLSLISVTGLLRLLT